MPTLLPKPIEPRRKRALQPMHSLDQIRPRRFESEVVVISHERKRVQPPAGLFTRLKQTRLERPRCRRRLE